MPTISDFYGIAVLMFWDDHNPPHFHVRYAGGKATVSISDPRVLSGSIPRRAERLVMEWAGDHQAELIENWQLCKEMKRPKLIPPLP
ncbi:MAG: DUF4160 domain-containing protein [Pseudomonadota bacterium]